MTVHGIRKNVEKKSPGVSEIASPENMNNLLSEADYVVLALPLTDETRGIIGPETLSTMKETAILINVSRGEVLQQGPLIEALKEGSIGGAGLDVFKEEPLPEESPLWGMENVIVTPHFAGLSDDYLQVALNLFWENLEKYLRGERLINEVDLQTGY